MVKTTQHNNKGETMAKLYNSGRLFLLPFMALVLMAVGLLPAAVQASSDMGDAINIAGRQRMLTQKMSKEILLIAAGIDVAGNQDNLKKTATLFDASLKGLQDFGHANIAAQLKVVTGLWETFHKHVSAVLAGDTSKDVLLKIATENMPLLTNMNTTVQMYTKAAGSTMSQDLADTINIAGRQRMLTQKMSKEILLIALGIDTASNTENLQKTAELFDTTLKGLKDFGDAEITAQLQVVSGLWNKFHTHIQAGVSGNTAKAVLQSIADENMPLLQNMNKAVQMYAKMAK